MLLVGCVEVNRVLDALLWYIVQNLLDQVAVRVNDRNAGAGVNILPDAVKQQCRFAGAALAYNIRVTVPD